jgi:SAM-dependent methyltransferase
VGERLYKTMKNQLAFGVVPAYRRFELHYARYLELVPVLSGLMQAAQAAHQPLKVLDIGAGGGEAKRFSDQLAGPASWTAIEISPEGVAASKKLGYETVLDSLDLEKEPLPFASETFSAVIASHVLEHLENAPAALAECYRVLAPGGALVVGVPMHLSLLAALATLRYRLFGRRPRGHCWFYSMRTLKSLLAGYPVERIWGFRVVSARRQLPLEDWEWFFRLSLWLGSRFPALTAEVNVLVRKPAARWRPQGRHSPALGHG